MPAQQRKSPDRKQPRKGTAVRQPGFAVTLLGAAGRGIARHPKPIVGLAAFGVIFSFVAANALWYQSGDHPHPFLATRDLGDPNAIAGYRPMRRVPAEDVTTYRIERADPNAAQNAAQNAAKTPPATAPAQPVQSAQPGPAQPQSSGEATNIPPVTAPVVMPRPAPPQDTARTATQPLARPATQPFPPAPRAAAAPVNRPPAGASARPEDPIAAAIRSSERLPSMTPPADIPNTGSTPRANVPLPQRLAGRPAEVDLVVQIQRGLSNIAYADVEVDGVAGSQTKAAIRRFQKHYRLPETGEPDDMVLKKLKSIGAL